MSDRNSGDRFPLLLYGRVIARYRGATLTLAVLLLALWYPVSRDMLAWPRPPADGWLLAGGSVSLAVWLLARLAPGLAYVQPQRDHLRLQTPIYRMKISYQRIHNTRPIDFARMYPPPSLRSGDREILRPFFGQTALGVDLRGLPLSPFALRLFFSRFLFANDQPGLVLMVDDWMALGRQLSTMMDAWRAANQPRTRGPGSGVAAILGED